MRFWQTKKNDPDIADNIAETFLGAGETNSFLSELENIVVSGGLTPSNAAGAGEDVNQLAKAVSVYAMGGAQYHLDTGAVNAYVLTNVSPRIQRSTYFDGMTISFYAGTVNTGPSTVNVNSIGAVPVTFRGGGALGGGELQGLVTLVYLDSGSRFETNVFNLPTNQDMSEPGYIIFHQGRDQKRLVMQWAIDNGLIAGQAISFPITFTGGVLGVLPVDFQFAGIEVAAAFACNQPTTTGFNLVSEDDADACFWVAFGII
jgi:hypothetical protein